MSHPWQREFLRASAAELRVKPPVPMWARFTLAFCVGCLAFGPTLGALVTVLLTAR